MFNENSAVVNSWVELINAGVKKLDDIPNLFNLQDVVAALVNAE